MNEQEYKILASNLTKDKINEILIELKIDETYDTLNKKLSETYNELSISDMIYDLYDIKDSKYPLEIIDVIIDNIVQKECYDFKHYGIIIKSIEENQNINNNTNIDVYINLVNDFLDMAKHFNIDNFDKILYEVNDGFDFQTFVNDILDECKEIGVTKKNKQYLETLRSISSGFIKQFKNINDYFLDDLNMMLATSHILLGNEKIGNKMFERLIKDAKEPVIMILYYGLSYIDNNSDNTLKIFTKYKKEIDQDKENSIVIKDILKDLKGEKKR